MINQTYFWTVVFFMMLGTLTIRGTLIAASARVKIPERVRELFSFIPAAILPAFVAPTVFFHHGHVGWMWGKERMVILILAALVCLRTRSTLATIIFGMVALYVVAELLN